MAAFTDEMISHHKVFYFYRNKKDYRYENYL